MVPARSGSTSRALMREQERLVEVHADEIARVAQQIAVSSRAMPSIFDQQPPVSKSGKCGAVRRMRSTMAC